MKNILKNSFYQLLTIYSFLIILIAIGLFWKYSLQFHVLALFIALFGVLILHKEQLSSINLNKKLHYSLFCLAVFFIIFLRTIPYFNNSIPLGYDAGIYKYGIEKGLIQLDNWILNGGHEPGFLYLMEFFKLFFSIDFILTYLLIIFCAVLGLGVYFLVKQYSDKTTGLIALFLYSFSIVQYKAFSMMYYRNILGMILILFSLYFLKKYEMHKNKKSLIYFIILSGLILSIHRPSFYIFGLSYFFYVFINPIDFQKKSYDKNKLFFNFLIGIAIILVGSLFYLGKFQQALFVVLPWVAQGFIQPGQSPGTFINFFTFEFSSLFYLPLAILGVFYFVRKKEFNLVTIWAIINFIIVYFQFFFFNRFIIFLDLVLIIMASFGFSVLIKEKKKFGIVILLILLVSAGILIFKEAQNTFPLISEQDFLVIKQFQQTPLNSCAMSTSSSYSPWIIGYSERKTIAPGLFDYDLNNETQWIDFWQTTDINKVKSFMTAYKSYNCPIYLLIGEQQRDNLEQFPECFSIFYKKENSIIYEYIC